MTLIQRLLRRDEGFRRAAYYDHLGFLTIGIGRLIDARRGGGITEEEALYLLDNDIRSRLSALDAEIPWWKNLDEVRRAVLLSMSFQLGVDGLLSFRATLRAVREKRYGDAADLMLLSKWAQQTPLRAHRLSDAMRSGDAADLRLEEDDV